MDIFHGFPWFSIDTLNQKYGFSLIKLGYRLLFIMVTTLTNIFYSFLVFRGFPWFSMEPKMSNWVGLGPKRDTKIYRHNF